MPTDWEKIARETREATNEKFRDRISSLTRLTNDEIENLINDTGISQTDLTAVLKEIEDATKSNEAKANAISNINKGVSLLVGIAKKFVL